MLAISPRITASKYALRAIGPEPNQLTVADWDWLVEIVTETLAGEVPRTALAGLKVQAANCGRFEHENEKRPVKPPSRAMESAYVAGWPLVTVAIELDPLAGAIWMLAPLPLSAMVCDFEGSLSLIVSAPERLPVPLGWKVTEAVQFPPGTTVPQVFASEKSPVRAIPEITRGTLPLLSIVTVCADELVPTI
jgi:hypothetical protein